MTLLTTIQVYPGGELLQAWNLRIDPSLIKPLLDEKALEQLKQDYLEKKEGDLKEWMKNTLELETQDWRDEVLTQKYLTKNVPI